MESRLLFFASPEVPSAPDARPTLPDGEAAMNQLGPDVTAKKERAAERRKQEEEEKAKQGDPELILLRGITAEEVNKKSAASTGSEDAAGEALSDQQKSIVDDLAQLPLAADQDRKAIVARIIAAGPDAIRPLLNAISGSRNRPHVQLYRNLLRQLVTDRGAGDFVEESLRGGATLASADIQQLGSGAVFRLRLIVSGDRWNDGVSNRLLNNATPEEQQTLRSRAVVMLRPLMALPNADPFTIGGLHERYDPGALGAMADLNAQGLRGIRQLSYTASDSHTTHQELAMRALLAGLRRNGQRLFGRTTPDHSEYGSARDAAARITENLRRALDSSSPAIRTQAAQALRIMLTLPDTAFEGDAEPLAEVRESLQFFRKRGGPLVYTRLYRATASEAIQTCLVLLRDGAGGQPLAPNDVAVVINAVGPTTLGFFARENVALRKQWVEALDRLRNDSNADISTAARTNLEAIDRFAGVLREQE